MRGCMHEAAQARSVCLISSKQLQRLVAVNGVQAVHLSCCLNVNEGQVLPSLRLEAQRHRSCTGRLSAGDMQGSVSNQAD